MDVENIHTDKEIQKYKGNYKKIYKRNIEKENY